MDDDSALDVLRGAADTLARDAAGELHRAVPAYPEWSVADLVVHTGGIHRWVTHIVETRATQRPSQPDIDRRPDDLIAWFEAGARGVADVLAACPPSTDVWTFAGERTARFWRRRMALETTIHRWDVQQAVDRPAPIADDVAAAGVTEALEVYLGPRSRDTAVGGGGEVVVLRAADGTRAWAVRLHSDAIEVVSADHAGDVVVTGTSARLWLFLMGRVPGTALAVRGPTAVSERLERAIAGLEPPSR
ncbi:MAG: maleylpyruvate isomerase family mycothiol-dependent enzyme [Actinobacteria bacterium]|nr:maleylpyruvate isomerase family mycothiol-dependent enzyme [Actinomycetota bacterium]